MATLIIENVPPDVYQRLEKRATAQQRSVPEEMLHLLRQLLQEDTDPPSRPLPEIVPSEEISAPFDLPRSSTPVKVVAKPATQPRLPDPVFRQVP